MAAVEPGEAFRVECMKWTAGQILNNDTADDVRDLDLSRTHYLSGPIAVHSAEPGDLLSVEVLGFGVRHGAEWGFSAILGREDGLLFDRFREPRKAIWDIDGIYATSRHIEGVRLAGNLHIGIIGCAPSHELLRRWNQREAAVAHPEGKSKPVPSFATGPSPEGALLGALNGPARDRAASEGAQVFGLRETGGYCGDQGTSTGSRLIFPVSAPGGNLSLGRLEFSKGDGKILFAGAISAAGWADLKVELLKGAAVGYGVQQPMVEPGPLRLEHAGRLLFKGFSADPRGCQQYLDPYTALRCASERAIHYLTNFGYTPEQAYMLLAALPCESHIDTLYAFPSAVCSISLPTGAFTFDVRPAAEGPSSQSRGRLAAPDE